MGGEVSFWDWTGGNVEVEKLFRFFLNAPEALPYWLQEAKRLQESLDIAHMAYEGLQEDCVSRGEYASLLGKLTTMTVYRNTEKDRADAAEARINKLERELNSKKQLLRETDQSRTEVREMYRSVCDTAQEYKDNLELAEAREQRLKKTWQQLREIVSTNATGGRGEDINDYDIMLNIMDDLLNLSTLYPDTPAPKEGIDWLNEESCARCGRNKPVEGYEWCSECRPDLEAKEGK
ncbi:hypothetical protein [Paenibacillus odorifer]|uniref:Zinc ribbon domain-containing protein n=1 Tax=Paenibacillus odorifer TaxID=189426 RepID=A0ABX3GTA3_9BACL|nr:hypothetical protein [Paenibacillus odorifer]OMD34796.1 hypothetical protein BSO21_10265 [Paenibacillus odorifer]